MWSGTTACVVLLTLVYHNVCEETSCPPGQFGLRCERRCNCADGGDCFVHSGGCPSGCAPGFTGEDCYSECPIRSYGLNCAKTCSVYCLGLDKSCSPVDGSCDLGCEPGYLAPLCNDECPKGKYGPGCGGTCSDHCDGPGNECDFRTGRCYQGCQPGFQPPTCHDECERGAYGKDCEETCSVHCAGHTCNNTDGSCDHGCEPGYQGRLCSEVCLRGKYGPGCSQTCSVKCAGQHRPCHHVDGSCYLGCVQDEQYPMCRTAEPQHDVPQKSGPNIWGIIGTAVAVVAVVVAVVFIILWRRSTASRHPSQGLTNKGFDGGMEMGSKQRDPLGKRQKPTQQSMASRSETSNNPYEQMGANIIRPDESTEPRQMPNQQGTYISGRPNQDYETTDESDLEYTVYECDPEYCHTAAIAAIAWVYSSRNRNYSPADIVTDYEIPLPRKVGTESSSQEMDETEQAPDGTYNTRL